MEQRSATQVNIETTELRGINLKTLRGTIVWGLSSMVTIICCTVYLVTSFKDITAKQDKINEITSLQVRTLDIRITNLELEQKNQRDKLEDVRLEKLRSGKVGL